MAKEKAGEANGSDNELEGLSEGALASLTDEERAGLEGDDGADEGDDAEGDDGADAEGDGAADSEEGDGSDEDAGEGDGANDDDADAATAAAAAAEALAAADTAAEDAELVEADEDAPDPTKWNVPEDINEQIAKAKTDRRELAERFDEGHINGAEFQTQLDELSENERALKSQLEKAQSAFEDAQDNFVRFAVKPFLKANPQFGPDNEILHSLLDSEVRRLQTASDNPFKPSLILKAHRNITAALAAAGTPLAANDNPKSANDNGKSKKPAKQVKPPTPAGIDPAKKPVIPPTLARTPAADITEAADGGRFARLERMAAKGDPGYEAAVERLKKTDQAAYDEYMRGAA